MARWKWAAFPACLFLFSRLGIFLIVGWSLKVEPLTHRPSDPLAFPVLDGLCRWDCGWYAQISAHGYQFLAQANFFPLFPLLGRALSAVTHLPPVTTLPLCANLLGFAALLTVYRVFEQSEGEEVAQLACLLWVAWPFSFFQSAGYAESAMVLATASALYLSSKGRHLAAGTALGLGILARHLCAIALPALLYAQIRKRGSRPAKLLGDQAIWGLVVACALGSLYPRYLHHHFGDALAFIHARTQTWSDPAWAAHSVVEYFRPGNPRYPEIGLGVFLSVIPGLGAGGLLLRKKWWAMASFAIPLMVLAWMVGLAGLGRYTGSAWPAFLPLGLWLAHKWPKLKYPTVYLFAVVQGVLVYLYSHSYPIN